MESLHPLLHPTSLKRAQEILDYLQSNLPGYPFDPAVDEDFVDELLDDFYGLDVLEEIKAFRWYRNNRSVSHLTSVRLSLRRWIANKPQRNR